VMETPIVVAGFVFLRGGKKCFPWQGFRHKVLRFSDYEQIEWMTYFLTLCIGTFVPQAPLVLVRKAWLHISQLLFSDVVRPSLAPSYFIYQERIALFHLVVRGSARVAKTAYIFGLVVYGEGSLYSTEQLFARNNWKHRHSSTQTQYRLQLHSTQYAVEDNILYNQCWLIAASHSFDSSLSTVE
jgi:hypothetical protein